MQKVREEEVEGHEVCLDDSHTVPVTFTSHVVVPGTPKILTFTEKCFESVEEDGPPICVMYREPSAF